MTSVRTIFKYKNIFYLSAFPKACILDRWKINHS